MSIFASGLPDFDNRKKLIGMPMLPIGSSKFPPPTAATKVTWYSGLGFWGKVILFSLIFVAVASILLLMNFSGVFNPSSRVAPLPPPVTASAPVAPTAPVVTDPASPAPSATDPASPTPSVTTASPSLSNCAVPDEPEHSVAINQLEPAYNLSWMEGLDFDRIVYDGEAATVDELKTWVNAAACQGMVAEIQPDKVLGSGSVIQTAQGTFCWDDWPIPVNSKCTDPTKYLPLYVPYPEVKRYGPISNYTKVGEAATSGWAAVQAFGHWESSSDMRHKFGFPKTVNNGRPPVSEVKRFAELLNVDNILVYQELPYDVNSPDAHKQYLNEVAAVVRGVLNSNP